MTTSEKRTTAVAVKLKIGSGQNPGPAPAELSRVLKKVVITRSLAGPSGFQLSFEAARYEDVTATSVEHPLLATGLLEPFNRVQIEIGIIQDVTEPMLDGYITRVDMSVEGEATRITVLGEDLSVKMDLFEVSQEFEQKTDSQIASAILASYSSLGLSANVVAPQGESAPSSYVPQQNCTDRYLLQMLAARHGHEFYVVPGSSLGQNTAYWGPPETDGTPQRALSVNFGPRTNVLKIEFRHDSLAPTQSYGRGLDLSQSTAQIVRVAAGSPSPPLGLSQSPAMSSFGSLAQNPDTFYDQIADLDVRGSLLLHPGMTPAQTNALAQGKTNRSVIDVITVEGELNAEKYGAILEAPGIVELRGSGKRFDGRYMVRKVTHTLDLLDKFSYRQNFTLSRGGTGSTISEVQDWQ